MVVFGSCETLTKRKHDQIEFTSVLPLLECTALASSSPTPQSTIVTVAIDTNLSKSNQLGCIKTIHPSGFYL